MKIKKMVVCALGALVAAFALNLGGLVAFAEENSGCYVVTEQTPDEIVDYAKGEFSEFLYAHLSSNGISAEGKQFTLGSPINLQETGSINRIYDFPVMCDGEIFAILTIYDDGGEYYTQFEQNLMADKLDELQSQSSKSNPIVLASDGDGLFAVLNGNAVSLVPDVDDNSLDETLVLSTLADDGIVVDVKDVLAVADEMGIMTMDTSNPIPLGVKSVPQTDDGTFSGTEKKWCGAAVTAAIINYKKGTSLTAKDVTIEALGSDKDEGITNDQVVEVAKKHDLSPKTGDPLSYSSVQTQINAYRPIFMQMQRSTDEGKKYHALALIGYSSTKYTIINPWYSNSLTIDKKDSGSNVIYVTGTRTYKWYKSVYNW